MSIFNEPQQQKIIIETVKETSRWWVPIVVAFITTAGALLIAKKNRKEIK